MKHFIFAFAVTSAFSVAATPSDTIREIGFGCRTGTYVNSVTAIQAAIDSCRSVPGAVLLFEPGRYDIWPEGAKRKEIYISNTSSEIECPSKVKTLGLHFNGIEGLTVEGSGATLMMHGKITPIAIDSCGGVTLRNLSVDFERPGGSEMTYTEVSPGKVVMSVHPDTRYDITDRRISLIGEGWRSNRVHCISYSPTTDHATYSGDWNLLSKCDVEEIRPGVLAFTVPLDFSPEVGATLTLRDIIRDQVGTLIIDSHDIKLEDVNMRYMHGLGIVSQYTRNVTMHRVNCRPSETSGRILASSADFMHFSGCSGAVEIKDCNFSGSHDDAINVHGTNLRVEDILPGNALRLRFMHHQSYGFMAYHPGDTVAFVDPSTMLRGEKAVVTSVVMENPRNLTVAFDRKIPASVKTKFTCVENLTCTPTLHVSGCTFTRHSTRGILATTPRKVIIENNIFTRLGMAAVLIEGDAEGWFESGPVTDVTIRDNTFVDCGYNGATHGATIALNPSNTVISAKAPVHEGVRIVGNKFLTSGRPVLYAKSTAQLLFMKNIVEGDTEPVFILNGCKDVEIVGNQMKVPQVEQSKCLHVKVKD